MLKLKPVGFSIWSTYLVTETHLSIFVAEHKPVDKEESATSTSESELSQERQIERGDLGGTDQVGTDKDGDERHHHEVVVPVLPWLRRPH